MRSYRIVTGSYRNRYNEREVLEGSELGKKISATEAARRYGVNERTVRTWIKQGVLQAEKARVSGPMQHAIDTAELELLLIKRHLIGNQETLDENEIGELTKHVESIEGRLIAIELLLADQYVLNVLKSAATAPLQGENLINVVQYPLIIDTPTAPPQAQKTVSPSTTGLLPMGFTPFEQFTHGVPKTTARKWRDKQLQDGQTWIKQGNWLARENGHPVSFAIAPEGHQAYHAWASTRRGFEQCPHCTVCQMEK